MVVLLGLQKKLQVEASFVGMRNDTHPPERKVHLPTIDSQVLCLFQGGYSFIYILLTSGECGKELYDSSKTACRCGCSPRKLTNVPEQ